MIPPSLLVQLVGWPPVAYTLFAFYAFVVWQWYEHPSSGFVFGVLAIAAAWKTLFAFDKRRRFKEWEAIMNRMMPKPEPVEMPPLSGWWAVFGIFMALMMMWFTSSCLQMVSPHYPRLIITLYAAWASSLLYLVWTAARLLLRLYRYMTRGKATTAAPAEVEEPQPEPVVAWTLERPSFSPSRAMVESELPDYCAGMMRGSP